MTWPWWVACGYLLARGEESVRNCWRERQRTRALERACPTCGQPRAKLNGVVFCPRCSLELLDRMM